MRASILIHPSEISRRWIDRMADSGIDTLGIHPEGGGGAIASLEGLINTMETEDFRALIDYARERGLNIEYEFHAFGYLLPRSLFSEHPEYFVMNERGERTPKLNFCPSSPEALDIVAKASASLVKKLYGSSHNYFLWSDDARGGVCHCPKCKNLSPADQQLTVLNAIIKEIRRDTPDARLAYLAYYDTLSVPKNVRCEDGIFLEFAPIDKWHVRTGRTTHEYVEGAEREELASEELLRFFGKKNSRVLEYWIDNSLFSGWKKPPVKLSCDKASTRLDIEKYLALGYDDISTFGCFLGEDYEALWGEPDISAFTDALIF
ncbi:MAG: DUF4838 domain-containing protein [Clostridia bacterium]|nr:DUF4838 domain-containing protein [Clostridia bacterium]